MFAASPPFPPLSGRDLRVAATARALQQVFDVTVFTLAPPQSTRAHGIRVRGSMAFAGQRAGQPSELGPDSLQWLREPGGHPSDRWYSPVVVGEIAATVAELGAQLIVLETLWLQRYIAPLRALGCRVVLDAHGVEASLSAELALRRPTTLTRMLAERTRVTESQAVVAADAVWIPSERDAQLARELYGDVELHVVPNVIDVDRYGGGEPGEEFGVIFTATFSYLPNLIAGRRLIAILPELRRCVPDARLWLVGRDPPPEMAAAAAMDERIEVTGPVADVEPYLARAAAMAVPLSEGHGTRFKVLEAFASRTPVVSSAKGVEGIDAAAGEHYLPAETDAEFVAALERLARDSALRERLVARGLELVRERYSMTALTGSIRTALRCSG